jgi:hypothetical protein
MVAWLFNLLPKYKRSNGELVKRGDRFMKWFWTTYRLPFCKGVIGYSTKCKNPMALYLKWLRGHELVHAVDQRTAWGLFKSAVFLVLIPLPVLFSGRWFIERWAYLGDIKAGVHTVKEAVDQLWYDYFFPWPRSLMQRWFEARLESTG